MMAIKESNDLATSELIELMGLLPSHEEQLKRLSEILDQAFVSKIKITDLQSQSNNNNCFKNRKVDEVFHKEEDVATKDVEEEATAQDVEKEEDVVTRDVENRQVIDMRNFKCYGTSEVSAAPIIRIYLSKDPITVTKKGK